MYKNMNENGAKVSTRVLFEIKILFVALDRFKLFWICDIPMGVKKNERNHGKNKVPITKFC